MLMTAAEAAKLNQRSLNAIGLMTPQQVDENRELVARLSREAAERERERERLRRQAEAIEAQVVKRRAVSSPTVDPRKAMYQAALRIRQETGWKFPLPVPPIRLSDQSSVIRSAAVGGGCRCVCVNGTPAWVCQ